MNLKNMDLIKISDFFFENNFALFRKYCRKKNIIYLYDLKEFNFNILFEEPSFGIGKVNIIKKLYNKIHSIYESNIHYNNLPSRIKYGFPLFTNNGKTEEDIEVSQLFNNYLISNYDFSVRATNVFKKAKLTTIRELLLLTDSELLVLKNCGITTISEIFNVCKDILSKVEIKWINTEIETILPVDQMIKKEFTIQALNKLPIFSNNVIQQQDQNLHDSYYGDYLLSDIPFDVRTSNTFQRIKLVHLKDLLFFPNIQIKHISGSGVTTIKNIQSDLINFYEVLYSENEQLESFQELLANVIKVKQNNLLIFLDRLSSTGKKGTLEYVGKNNNITRERVRQIVGRIENLLSYPFILLQLEEFYDAVDLVLDQYIGAVNVDKINNDLSDLLGWTKQIEPELLLNFCAINTHYKISKQDHLLFHNSNECSNCNKFVKFTKQYFEKNDSVTEINYCKLLYNVCQQNCPSFSISKQIDPQYVNWIISKDDELIDYCVFDEEEKVYYSKTAWEQKNRSNSNRIIELLELVKTSIPISDFVKIVNSELDLNYSSQSLQTSLSCTDNLYFWDRGTIIAKKNFIFPHKFIMNIIEKIVYLLNKNNYPVLYVNGIYKNNKKSCLQNKIPNQTALYSLLRGVNDSRLTLKRYPAIYLTSTFKKHKNITKEIILFVQQNKNKYIYTELCDHFINALGAPNRTLRNAIYNSTKLEINGKYIEIVDTKSNTYKRDINTTENHINDVLQTATIGVNYIDLLKYNNILLDDSKKYFLQQLQQKKGTISSIRLNSLSRIKKIDFNTIIFTLNNQFRKIYNIEFLILENEIWRVDPFFNHLGNWTQKVNLVKTDSETIYVKFEEKKPEWFLRQIQILENNLKHAETSHNYYWFKALLTLIDKKLLEASFNQMVALMCSHAWNDVLQKNCSYSQNDKIPNIVRRIYLASNLQSKAEIDLITEHLFDNLEKYNKFFENILQLVPHDFLNAFIEKNMQIKSEVNIIDNFYKIIGSKVVINSSWNKYVLYNFDEINKVVLKLEKCEEK